MMPFDDAIAYMQRMAQDSSSSALVFLKLMYNVGYKIILTEFGRAVLESEATTELEANTPSYQVPPDCQWVKTVILVNGTSTDPLTEVVSDREWAMIKSGS